MANIFFRFLIEKAGRQPPTVRARLILMTVILSVAFGLAPLRAGLLPAAKDRAQADTLSQQAASAYQGGDYNGALRFLDQAEQIKPDQADNWNLRGVIYLKQKNYDQAERAFARSVAIDPSLWAAQFNVAEASFQKKDFARARTLFDRLLAQTDRFKETNKWELVLYKGYLCALLKGDDADARKKLAKLPPTGGKTPAFQYAQAALLFSRKDAAGARKILLAAQPGYAASVHEMFASSLEVAGWQSPSPLPLPGSSPPLDPASVAAMNAAGLTNPATLYLPPAARAGGDRPAVVIDPKLEASVAEPLPSSPGSDLRPVATQLPPAGMGKRGSGSPRSTPAATPAVPAATPAVVSVPRPLSTPQPDSPIEHGGLLLDID